MTRLEKKETKGGLSQTREAKIEISKKLKPKKKEKEKERDNWEMERKKNRLGHLVMSFASRWSRAGRKQVRAREKK